MQVLQSDIDSRAAEIASLRKLSESLMADDSACPTEADKKDIQQAIESIDELWPAINSASAERTQLQV